MNNTRQQNIVPLLSNLEHLLKINDLWQDIQPEKNKLMSKAPFCCDTLAFEQWLQFVFIPKITNMVNKDIPLPTKIAITPMAQEAFKAHANQGNELILVISAIDSLLSQ
jgi:uncharacterized protein YqcC (DUF446 family)